MHLLIKKLKPDINKKGKFFDISGNFIGNHNGIANFTIGQRKGIGIGGSEKPLYVIDINKDKNQIILGTEESLKKTKIKFNKINWLDYSIKPKNLSCCAKIRSTQKELPGILNIENNEAEFEFETYVNATSPGQACVIYLNDQVLGGGWIIK